MLKMVRVELERDYEELWKEYNKELLGEPFLPKKYKVKADTNLTMTPEFQLVVRAKDGEVAAAEREGEGEVQGSEKGASREEVRVELEGEGGRGDGSARVNEAGDIEMTAI